MIISPCPLLKYVGCEKTVAHTSKSTLRGGWGISTECDEVCSNQDTKIFALPEMSL